MPNGRRRQPHSTPFGARPGCRRCVASLSAPPIQQSANDEDDCGNQDNEGKAVANHRSFDVGSVQRGHAGATIPTHSVRHALRRRSTNARGVDASVSGGDGLVLERMYVARQHRRVPVAEARRWNAVVRNAFCFLIPKARSAATLAAHSSVGVVGSPRGRALGDTVWPSRKYGLGSPPPPFRARRR